MEEISRQVLDCALLHDAITYWAARQPDHAAVDGDGTVLSYGALDLEMRRLAARLALSAPPANHRVVIFLDNGVYSSIAIMGVLAAGGCYVPIDPEYPALRVTAVLEEADASALVTVSDNLDRLLETFRQNPALVPDHIVFLDQPLQLLEERGEQLAWLRQHGSRVEGREVMTGDPERPSIRRTEEDLAYIIFTSGTTGRPKGVMLSHANVKAFIRWAVDYLSIIPADRIANHASIAFDLSVLPIYTAFFGGATLCPVIKPGDRAFPGGFIRRQKITMWVSVPSALGMMVKARQMRPGAYAPHLRLATFCGEALPPAYAAALRDTHPEVEIINLYGPTEAACACTFHKVGVDGPLDTTRPIPIGRPCRDTEILILDEMEDKPVPVGKVGRLMICGTQVARGYWRRADLTRRVFRINPMKADFHARMYETGDLAWQDASGCFHYAGRSDFQVKVGGHRIELGDIEAILGAHPFVNEAVVVHVPEDDKPLAAVVTARPGAEPPANTENALLDHCQSRLPLYMVPDSVVVMADLPKNANGKVDRNLLAGQLRP